MSINIDRLEKNKVLLTVDVTSEKLEKGLAYAYNKNKSLFVVPGFRKGKAPRYVIEKTYGKDVFFEDAINHIIDDVYESSVSETDLDVVSYPPEIDIKEIDPKTGAVITFSMYVAPEVTLGQYKDFEIARVPVEVTEDEVDEELMKVCEKNVRLVSVDKTIENGHVVTINFDGFVDGEPFDGGHAEDYDLEIGSQSFIDNFEEQLIGYTVGDDVEVLVTFPTNYHHKKIAGKQATFHVEILDIEEKQYPAIDDEFAQEVSEFDTLDEYKKSIFDNITDDKLKKAQKDKEEKIFNFITENAKMDIPDIMIEEELQNEIDSITRNLSFHGISLSSYLSFNNIEYDEFKESIRVSAVNKVSSRLVLDKVAETENLTVQEDDFRNFVKNMVKYNDNFDEAYSKLPEKDLKLLKKEFLRGKAFELIKETVVEV